MENQNYKEDMNKAFQGDPNDFMNSFVSDDLLNIFGIHRLFLHPFTKQMTKGKYFEFPGSSLLKKA